MELVDRVNKGELIDPDLLDVYQESSNSAEKFLAHHAHAMLDLRRAQQHMLQSLEAIDYSDQKVLNQFVSVSGFLGLTDTRCAPVVKFGASAIARRENALGLEAIQNGISYDLQHGGAYTADRETCQFVATQFERASQFIGFQPTERADWNNKQTKIAYLVSGIADDDSTSKSVLSLAKYHDAKRFKLQVFSTEAFVRHEKQLFAQGSYVVGSSKRGKETIDALNRLKAPAWLTPVDGDIVSSARELANQLIKEHIDVVIFDTTQADPIAALLANWDVARVKVNLCRKTPLYSAGMHCVTYVDQNRFDADKSYWQTRNIETSFVLEGIDTDEVLAPAPLRSAYGIPEAAVVLATAGNDLDSTLSEEFVETLISVLRSHPHVIYLAVGEGDFAWQKRKFESAGVAKRVGWTGKRKDLPGFLRIADVYLAEYPHAGATGVLQAMSMEKPVVAMRAGESPAQAQAAAFVGSEGAIGTRDSHAYVERVSKLVREPLYRSRLGKLMRDRVNQHFSFAQTARHIEQLIDQLIQQKSETSSTEIGTSQYQPERLADVA